MFLKNIVAVAGVLVVCAGSAYASGPQGTLHYGTKIQLNNWNPLVKPNTTYTGIVYESLVKVAPDGFTIQPSLATAWHLTPTKLDLTLQSGVVFHDGTPFNAEAVKKNIEWIKNSGSQWAAGFAIVSKIIAKDPTHVTFLLSEQAPTMLHRLASRGAFMVSPKIIAARAWDKDGGTGPWTYDASASQLGTKEVFHYFDRYWAPQNVGVKSIIVHVLQDPSVALNALVAGYVQATELSTSQLPAAKAAGFIIKATPTLVQHILFLDRKKTFADENVRKAVCLAADMKTLTEAGYDGYATPVSQKFPPGQPGYNPNVHGYPHDLAAAKKYMAAAGNPKISFVLPMYPGNRNLMTLFAQQLRQIGIDAKPQLMTTGQYFTYYQSDKYPLQINSSATENLGPLDYYQFRFSPGGTGNPFHVDVPGLDAIAKRALAVTDEKAQNKLWQEATQYIHDHALDCGFFRQETTWAYNSKKIANLPTTVLRPSALRYNEVKLAP
jgi:ABC-type transport system substrate-binding protein